MAERAPLVSGRQVAAWLGVAVLATCVLPPGLAMSLNARRTRQTEATLAMTAAAMRAGAPSRGMFVVACGPGNMPDVDQRTADVRGLAAAWTVHAMWLAELRPMSAIDWPAVAAPDAWGRCLMLRLRPQAAGVLLSAGANGLVETPRDSVTAQGDDIVTLLD